LLVSRCPWHIPEIQFTSHSFDIATLVVSFLGLKISCLIRIMLELTLNSDAFEFAVLNQPQLPRVILIKSDSNKVKWVETSEYKNHSSL